EPDQHAMIRYAGPDHTFPYIPYYQALDALTPGSLQDHIVIVGRDLRATTDQSAAQSDLFYTPFTSTTGWLTPGAEIHANILESVVRGDSFTPATDSTRLLLLIAAAGLATFAMRRWRPVTSALAGIAIIVAVGALAWLLFARWHLWLPVFGAMSSVVATYLVFGAVVFIA